MMRECAFLAKRFASFSSNVELSGLVCGKENCQGTSYDSTDDCCMLPDGGGDDIMLINWMISCS